MTHLTLTSKLFDVGEIPGFSDSARLTLKKIFATALASRTFHIHTIYTEQGSLIMLHASHGSMSEPLETIQGISISMNGANSALRWWASSQTMSDTLL